ncbi:MAG: SDR family NAD(P)-dependent oxidoreductase [Candidatus Eisenbacteria bacterium]|nr:SDR family NAD(P)-dependent oxidoreductase [Candidatus Eisenbacteria bacterium]MCC7143173.1 SDR family NAD(P)-dependent oxidoreductase [Candidatus Eisenbacteria bacterium]
MSAPGEALSVNPDVAARPVLVTGASTGIGRHLTERLAALGHPVFAGARKPTDLEALGAIPNVTALRLDVSNPQDVADAVEAVQRRGLGLRGLVNNAGLGGLGLLTSWSDEELRELFEVNALAPIRLVRAFLPQLLVARGRVVNIGSQGGTLSMRYYGPYTMTKHALEAFNTALADELAPHGIGVSIVQPGGVESAIIDSAMPGIRRRFLRAGPPFEEEAAGILAEIDAPPPAPEEQAKRAEASESAENRKPSSPEIVTVAALDALFAPAPRKRYLVGTRWEGGRVLRALIERLLDANACPTLGYTVTELVAMLEEQAQARAAIPAESARD